MAVQKLAFLLVLVNLQVQAQAQDIIVQNTNQRPAPILAEASASDIDVVKPVTRAFSLLQDQVVAVINTQRFQGAIAGIGLFFGLAAMIDGCRFFKLLVSVSIVGIIFAVAISQLDGTWEGQLGHSVAVIASLEIALFFGAAAYVGWEGAQLILGLTLGWYLFRAGEAVIPALLPQTIQTLPNLDSGAWAVGSATICVLLGTYLINDKGGAARVLAVLAPLLGASMVVASGYFLVMLSTTMPNANPHTPVADMPAVLDFWAMMVTPWKSRAVGLFSLHGTDVKVGATKIEPDRAICMAFWFILFVITSCLQWKSITMEKQNRRKQQTGLLESLI
jgi:hypothetical protein